MKMVGRRWWWLSVVLLVGATDALWAGDVCRVAHPFRPPQAAFSGRCPNCGMTRAMWARTWYVFHDHSGARFACSMHCLADMTSKSGEIPRDVQVALYLSPEKTVPAAGAYFVVGGRAPGTMTAQSKPAFAGRAEAEAFAASCGGTVMDFTAAFGRATAGLAAENTMIARRRLKKGKIVEPVDGRDHCAVCEMFPARYPRHRAQVRAGSAAPVHFCSTRCLFDYLARMRAAQRASAMVWVTDVASGDWISGLTAFYVVGSGQWGPMGAEAFAYGEQSAAAAAVAAAGKGRVLRYDAVTLQAITASP